MFAGGSVGLALTTNGTPALGIFDGDSYIPFAEAPLDSTGLVFGNFHVGFRLHL